MSMRDIEDRGFYTETFHSVSWIYHGDEVNQNESAHSLSSCTRPAASGFMAFSDEYRLELAIYDVQCLKMHYMFQFVSGQWKSAKAWASIPGASGFSSPNPSWLLRWTQVSYYQGYISDACQSKLMRNSLVIFLLDFIKIIAWRHWIRPIHTK